MNTNPFIPLLVGAQLLVLSSPALHAHQGGRPEQVLDSTMHHLGDDSTPEWPEAPAEPEGTGLRFEFEASAVHGPWTLAYFQRHVTNDWRIEINGKLVCPLKRGEGYVEHYVPVPAGVLQEGTNVFELLTDTPADDITFGRIRLIPKSYRDALNLVPVSLAVREKKTTTPIPARFTVLDAQGKRAMLHFADLPSQAQRPGVVYSHDGSVYFEVPEGTYSITASRGMEWSIDTKELTFRRPENHELGGLRPVDAIFSLDREVDTSGYVAADTHIHTLTFSGHGDSNVEERMITLAGEGVELAISTDHNHNTDYAPTQQAMGLGEHFTPVVGNEVTTPIGHFNGFPLDPEDEVPPYDLHDMVQIVNGMRNAGALVVILNHPRWPAHDTGPFGVYGLDHHTGHSHATSDGHAPYDAMELVNSTTEEHEPMLLFRDWFALLNRGELVAAVGSSDSHTVGDPVGGGRTYVPSDATPAHIDVEQACHAIATGQTSIAMGIFVTATVRPYGERGAVARFAARKAKGMGELFTPRGDYLESILQVHAPSWITPRKAELYANGELVKRIRIEPSAEESDGPGTHREYRVVLNNRHRGQDAWLVWVVTGDGVEGEHWPLHNDYTLGATNPIFVDWSRDGVYQSPRETAEWMAETLGEERAVTASSWKAVSYHALELLREKLEQQTRDKLLRIADEARLDEAEVEAFLDAGHDRDHHHEH